MLSRDISGRPYQVIDVDVHGDINGTIIAAKN